MSQTLTAYNPSLREKIAYWLAGGAEKMGAGINTQRAIVGKAKDAIDFVPGVGDAVGFNEAGRDIKAGNYGTGAMGMGLATLGLLPGAGDIASKAGKKLMNEAVQEAPKGIRAFHGSPHSFDKFSLDKIGTGEGAQAYGHGLYFAENEGVAKGYRDTLGGADSVEVNGKKTWQKGQSTVGLGNNVDAENIATDALSRFADTEQASWWLRGLTGQYEKPGWSKARDEAIELLKSGKAKVNVNGSMYEVNINANPDDFLDWDKPLSEQPEGIRRKLGWTAEQESAYKQAQLSDDDALLAALNGDASSYKNSGLKPPSGLPSLDAMGSDIARGTSLFDKASDVEKSLRLKEAGIPGIKYLDAGSRGAGDGSRNYVVFDDKLIDIVKKYGIAGASAMLGYNVLGGMNDAQAGELNAADKQFNGGGNMIEVELPDGSIAEFPEGTTPDVIKGALQKRFAAPQAQPSPQMQDANAQLSALTQNADPATGDRMAFDALPTWQKPLVAASDVAQLGVTGLTGGLVNAGAAAVRAPFTDKTYSEELAAMNQSDQRAKNRSGSAGTAAEIGGMIYGLGKLQGAGATANSLIPAGLKGAKSLAARTGASIVDNLAINEAMNVGQGNDFGTNALLAAGLGGLSPAAGDVISAAGSKALGMFNKAPQTMDAEGLKQAAQAAYNRADDAGVVYSPQAINRVTNDLKGQFADFGYHPELQSGAKVALGELDRIGQGNVTLKGLDTARKVAGNAYQPMNKSNNTLTAKVSGAIDDLVQNPQAGDVVMGDAGKASAAITEARDLYGRSAKLERVKRLLDKAGLNAGSAGSGGNVENATRQQLKTLLTNPKNTRGMTADEIAATKRAVLGTPTQNALRLAGKLSPQGNGLMLFLGGAGAVANPAVALPAMAGGFLAKKGAERMTQSSVKNLEKLIASGGNKAAMQAPKNSAQKAIESKRELIARLLMGGGLAALPAN